MYWKNIGLLPKLTLIFVSIILFPMILSIIVTSHMIESKLINSKKQEGLYAAQMISDAMRALEKKADTCINFIRNDQNLIQRIDLASSSGSKTKDNQLNKKLTNISKMLGIELLQLTTASGRVLFSYPDTLPVNKKTAAQIKRCTSEELTSFILSKKTSAIISYMDSICFEDNAENIIIRAGFFLDKNWLGLLSSNINTKLGLIVDNKLIAHSFEHKLPLQEDIFEKIKQTGKIQMSHQSKDPLNLLNRQWLNNYLLVYIPVKNEQGNVLAAIVAGIDKRDVNTAINQSNTILSLITFIFIFIGIVISYYLSLRLVRPLDKLVSGSRRISQGNFDYKIKTQCGAEIGLLARSFNQMTLNLKKNIEQKEQYLKELESSNELLKQKQEKIEQYNINLEEKVKERTKKLNNLNEELFSKNNQLNLTMQELKSIQSRML